MFEKEAEEWLERYKFRVFDEGKCNDPNLYAWTALAIKESYLAGAEFGYNKANEWHYVNWKYFADKDCPKSELSSYLVQLKNKDFLICDWEMEEGFGCFWDSNLNPIDNDDVSAWKEIVLPKEIKEK